VSITSVNALAAASRLRRDLAVLYQPAQLEFYSLLHFYTKYAGGGYRGLLQPVSPSLEGPFFYFYSQYAWDFYSVSAPAEVSGLLLQGSAGVLALLGSSHFFGDLYTSSLEALPCWGFEHSSAFPSFFSASQGSLVAKDFFVDQELSSDYLSGLVGQLSFCEPTLPSVTTSFLLGSVLQDWRLLKLEREVWRTVDMLTLARQSAFYRKKFYSNFYDPASLVSKVSV
jgi:hypothetical protein